MSVSARWIQNPPKEIHPNNVKRVIRALEFYHENGETDLRAQ